MFRYPPKYLCPFVLCDSTSAVLGLCDFNLKRNPLVAAPEDAGDGLGEGYGFDRFREVNLEPGGEGQLLVLN
ncbi:MAG: hypothetical protein IPM55_21935 [Acidobacteria bacterium]|nr:hypothetical protein [Acidobacteriota bacterium]